MPKVSFVIINWNVEESLYKCVESVVKNSYNNIEIIIIDNNSQNFDKTRYLKLHTSIKVFVNSSNLGFPKAVNQGIKQSTGDYLVLLNPDTTVEKNFITNSLEFYSNYPDAGVMGPLFKNPDGTKQGSVFPEPTLLSFVKEFWLRKGKINEKYVPNSDSPQVVNCVSGGCMVIPRSTINKIGLLTEKVFMYYEDLDYCRRIRSSGLKVYFNPNIVIIHQHGESSKKSTKSLSYLVNSSKWYNGKIKHYLLWFISLTGQKLQTLFP